MLNGCGQVNTAMRTPIETSAIQWMLTEWGRWSRSDKRLGYPSCSTFEQNRGGGIASAMVTDETAGVVDLAVSQLRRSNPVQGKVIRWYYVKSLPIQIIARTKRHISIRHLWRLIITTAKFKVNL